MAGGRYTRPVMRFLTLGGAHVALAAGPGGYVWKCLGCDKANDFGLALPHARDEANEHASRCRSIPKNATDR